ncbi:MAG: DUF1003 domain-containing protein [Rhizobiales bacterium]|nr:DUF1003 domain-containing protein [Hyphomicrobiales bacterium]
MTLRDTHLPAGDPRRNATCAISGETANRKRMRLLDELPQGLQERILREHPDLPPDAPLSRVVIDGYRRAYLEDIIQAERGELSDLERDVAQSLAQHETISENVEATYETRRSVGERMADRLAAFGGSWTFLIVFAAVLIGWMIVNGVLSGRAFDPYPYILLNLVLSCIAAIQAPVIMMSQKRQEAKDRLRALGDYQVNLKAELEIRHLHDKIDHLLSHQWSRLAEIQRVQLELLQERRK